MAPFYKGYIGEIIRQENEDYICNGVIEIDLNTSMI